MKVLVIGGSQGMGKEIVDYFSPNSKSVSRSNGYDIRREDDRKKIAKLSLDYNVVLNHAYCGDLSQTYMLNDLYRTWVDADHNGYIFHTGTYSTYRIGTNPNLYPGIKASGDILCQQISKQCENNKHRFRITNLRLGFLDTEKSRKKPHWPGNGLKGVDVAKLMSYFYNMPPDICVPEIVLETKHNV